MKAVADRVPSAASVSMMDLSVEAEAFGSQVKVSDIEVPTVVGAVVTSEEEADALEVPEVGAGRTGLYIEAISNVCKMVDDRPVFAGVIGPFSLAGRLLDVTEALVYCYTEPDMVHTVMRKVTDFLHKYIDAYKQVGASGVVMAEPLTGILSPQLAVEFSEPYVRELVEAAQTDDFIVIYHNCGNNTIQMIDSILRVGAAAYHFGNSIKMADMMEKIPSDIVAMGNIDPAGQFRNGTPESIRAATLELMEELYPKYENFVISSAATSRRPARGRISTPISPRSQSITKNTGCKVNVRGCFQSPHATENRARCGLYRAFCFCPPAPRADMEGCAVRFAGEL
jgi:uroporphyrinogen decarboxylase